MGKGRLEGSVVAAIVAAAGVLPAGAGPGADDVLTASNRRARAVLEQAVAAHGGEKALRSLRTLKMVDEGVSYMLHHGPLPGRPLAGRRVGGLTQLDFERERGCYAPDVFTHSDTDRLADMTYVWHPRTIVRDGEIVTLNQWARTRGAPRKGGLEELKDQQRALPTRWLLEALDAAHTLTLVSAGDGAGADAEMVGMTTADGRAVALRFDRRTRLLEAVEALSVHPVDGDTRTVTGFSDYRRVGGVTLPARRVVRRGSDVLRDVRAKTLEVDRPLEESCFQVPEDFAERPAGERPPAGPVRLGEGVFLLQGLGGAYNGLVVLFDTFAMVVEAPENEPGTATTRQALAMLREVSGGRPLRYLAFTHFHLDHAGGIRDYVAEGVTVVTTPANRSWVEEAVRAPFTIVPDRLARAPRAAKIEVFEGRRHVIEEAGQRVEIHLVPWDHAREEAFFYLPRQRLVFEGDLFAAGHGDVPVAQGSAALLEARIRELGLDVETIVGVHGSPRPYADLAKALEKRRHRLDLTAGDRHPAPSRAGSARRERRPGPAPG
jgi:glyoxylase-like metal-dependent hydrolase (beta-lactamase superfamily II)